MYGKFENDETEKWNIDDTYFDVSKNLKLIENVDVTNEIIAEKYIYENNEFILNKEYNNSDELKQQIELLKQKIEKLEEESK